MGPHLSTSIIEVNAAPFLISQRLKIKTKPILTAVLFVTVVPAIIVAVASPVKRDTATVSTAELIRLTAGCTHTSISIISIIILS